MNSKRPSRRTPAITFAQNARVRSLLRQLWGDLGTQKAVSTKLGLRDRDARTVNDVLAGGFAPRRVIDALAIYRGTNAEEVLGPP